MLSEPKFAMHKRRVLRRLKNGPSSQLDQRLDSPGHPEAPSQGALRVPPQLSAAIMNRTERRPDQTDDCYEVFDHSDYDAFCSLSPAGYRSEVASHEWLQRLLGTWNRPRWYRNAGGVGQTSSG